MRRLVVCCDGTWNTQGQMSGGVPAPTNVVRLFHALEQSNDQLCYYHPGVGTGPGLIDRIAGGVAGSGLSDNVKSAYAWLAAHYEPGSDDAICLFGFSRGAFTVRSLAGMIRACGLPSIPADADPRERWSRIDELFAEYQRGAVPTDDGIVEIAFLGVWDTVGALGVPASLGVLRIIDDLGRAPQFHDTLLGPHVVHARHAVALDERRGPFVPTLWTNLPVTEPRTAEQVWFPGDHCDVGGGHPQTGLSDGALAWMIAEARACVPALRLREDLVAQLRPDPGDVVHDESLGLYRFLAPTPRAAPFLAASNRPRGAAEVSHDIHRSAYQRQATPPIAVGDYRPARTLGVNDSICCDVFAAQPWNWTGLYLEPGQYELAATGEWLDRTGPHDADGVHANRLHLPDLFHLANTAAGGVQDALKALTRDEAVTFLGAPRRADVAWMALLGAVAAPRFDTRDGRQLPYHQFAIRTKPSVLTVPDDGAGYFYAYANDAWGMYGDNRGSLSLSVLRTA